MLDPTARAAELDRAHRTLCRGAAFFAGPMGRGVPSPDRAVAISHRHRSKWLGNGLRELDRFLHHLLDAIAHAHGLGAAPEQRNSANKLRALRRALGRSGDDHARLLALGGTRACLFHCDGILRSSAMADTCWTGLGRDPLPAPFERGALLVLLPGDLRRVGRFYHALADDLVRCPSKDAGEPPS
jgi:hypothetical protein